MKTQPSPDLGSMSLGNKTGCVNAKNKRTATGLFPGSCRMQCSWRDGKYVFTEEVVRETRTMPRFPTRVVAKQKPRKPGTTTAPKESGLIGRHARVYRRR